MVRQWWLLVLCPVLSLVRGQAGNESKCTYTFTVPLEYFESQCMTQELQASLNEIRRENTQITADNAVLKEKIETLDKEYGDMVDVVKKLEQETMNWRQIVEWPSFDSPIGPENIKDIVDKENMYEDCYKALRKSASKKEGIYTLKPKNADTHFLAYCDSEGWTILSRRFDGHEEFYRDWSDYSGGFGEVNGEFWIGLEKMHLLTDSKKYQLRVEAVGWNDKFYHAEHDYFHVDGERTGYRLSIGNMTDSNHDDVMSSLDGLKFTTKGRDNDEWYQDNCAQQYHGGWWLRNCGFDPNRQWCDADGCMSFGKTRIKKIILKIRPMAAKSAVVGKSRPANQKPPSAKAVKPKKKKKNKKQSKKESQISFF